VPSWRDELIEAVKTKAEREAEELERHRKRVEEALATADEAMKAGMEALRFASDKLKEKGQQSAIEESADSIKLSLHDLALKLELSRESAIIKMTFGDAKPREFDFAKDRHISKSDVEEYVGRRALEFVRSAQKASPW
jgi:hypothetical protein